MNTERFYEVLGLDAAGEYSIEGIPQTFIEELGKIHFVDSEHLVVIEEDKNWIVGMICSWCGGRPDGKDTKWLPMVVFEGLDWECVRHINFREDGYLHYPDSEFFEFLAKTLKELYAEG